MKIRQGFVSNSSSSSFVFVTTIANHEKTLAALEEQVKEVMGKFSFTKTTCLGQDVMLFGDLEGHDGEGSLSAEREKMVGELDLKIDEDSIERGCDEHDAAYEIVSEAIESYRKEAKKNSAEVFEWQEWG